MPDTVRPDRRSTSCGAIRLIVTALLVACRLEEGEYERTVTSLKTSDCGDYTGPFFPSGSSDEVFDPVVLSLDGADLLIDDPRVEGPLRYERVGAHWESGSMRTLDRDDGGISIEEWMKLTATSSRSFGWLWDLTYTNPTSEVFPPDGCMARFRGVARRRD